MSVCPVCNGSGHMPCPDANRQYGIKFGWFGYRASDDTINCTNCGGQYQNGTPTGAVKDRPDGTPCTHSYTSKRVRNCLTGYTCDHCGDYYDIDSSD